MSEEEIIESVKYHILLEYQGFCNINKVSLQGLLDLYNKEKEKNKIMQCEIKDLLDTHKRMCEDRLYNTITIERKLEDLLEEQENENSTK